MNIFLYIDTQYINIIEKEMIIMIISDFNTNIKSEEIKKFIKNNNISFKNFLYDKVIYFRISDVSLFDIIMLAEINGMEIVKEDIKYDLYELTEESFYMPSVTRYSKYCKEIMNDVLTAYYSMLEFGIPEKDAAIILPLNLKTSAVVSIHGRNISNIIKLKDVVKVSNENDIIDIYKLVSEGIQRLIDLKVRKEYYKYDDDYIYQEEKGIYPNEISLVIANNYSYKPNQESSRYKHIYLNESFTTNMMTYLSLVCDCDINIRRKLFRRIEPYDKNITNIPESIRKHRKAHGVLKSASKSVSNKRDAINKQQIKNNFYLLCDIIKIDINAPVLDIIRYSDQLKENTVQNELLYGFLTKLVGDTRDNIVKLTKYK